TIPITQLTFLRGQNQFMKSKGFEVHGVSSPGQELDELLFLKSFLHSLRFDFN
ncbi:unnamed protein product, partial [marine sediment metagenome]